MLRRLIDERGADSAWLTASLFNTLVDLDLTASAAFASCSPAATSSVPHVRRALLRHPRLHLVNGYGPTENTTFTCCHVVTNDDLEEDDIPIGKAIAGTAVLLLDEHGQEIAEPDRRGDRRLRRRRRQGYRNDATRTRASFVEVALSRPPAACLTVPATALATTSRVGCASSAAAMARSN